MNKLETQITFWNPSINRNINNILESLDKQRETQYSKFKDMLFNSNQHVQDPDLDLERSRLFINRIKDHRHYKIKEKHINKFERLYFKHHGYLHNPNRQAVNLDNIDHQNTLSRHQNVPSSFSNTSTPASSETTVPAIPMAPHLPPAQQIPTQHLGSHPPATGINVQTAPTNG